MSDGRSNNGGARTGSGSPGYGKLAFLKEQVTHYAPLWWAELGLMLQQTESREDKRFAMAEFNKIQVKMIPQDLTSDGEKLLIQFDTSFNNKPDATTQTTEENSREQSSV